MSGRISPALWSRQFQRSTEGGMTLQGQIRQMLVTVILDGHLPFDASLPSSRELADQLGVARNTVVLAYQQLVDEGYLISRERSGHFINPDILEGRHAPKRESRVQEGAQPNWAERLARRPSAQRNIVKPSDWQRFEFPFIYGQFDSALFPTSDWRECCLKALSVMEIRDWAPDLIARDDELLVQQIRTRVLPRRGVWAATDEIVITMGAQQALYLLADLLMSERTVVGFEDPGYPDARNIFSNRTSALTGLPVDAGGITVNGALANCNYVYVTPSHQCPTTATMPITRREALLKSAQAHDFVIIEDDYESENNFSGTPHPALKSLDTSDRVIYIGSLTKSFAPGLRLGYIVGPRELVSEVRALRRLMIRHPDAYVQRAFATFLSLGHHDALLRRLAHAYQQRAQTLMAALERYLPQARFIPVSGGSSCWVIGPDWLDAAQLAVAAAQRGILIEPGGVFFMTPDAHRNCFRLGFSSIPIHKIDAGIRQLGELLQEQAPASRPSIA